MTTLDELARGLSKEAIEKAVHQHVDELADSYRCPVPSNPANFITAIDGIIHKFRAHGFAFDDLMSCQDAMELLYPGGGIPEAYQKASTGRMAEVLGGVKDLLRGRLRTRYIDNFIGSRVRSLPERLGVLKDIFATGKLPSPYSSSFPEKCLFQFNEVVMAYVHRASR